MTITQADWEAKGRELFGENKDNWRIHCPACGHVCSVAKAREAYPDVRGKGWQPVTECIGRYTRAVDCDWCAYGLFGGPLFVQFPEKEKPVPCFDFEGLPFTRPA